MVIVRLSQHFPVRVCEFLLASISISWGIVAFNLSPEAWNQSAYIGLARIAEPRTWGVVLFVIGVLRLIALIRNGGWRPSPHLRAAGAFLSCFAWLQITLGIFSAPLANTGMAVYPWLLLADIYNVFRASHDARLSDERARQARAERGTMSRAEPS